MDKKEVSTEDKGDSSSNLIKEGMRARDISLKHILNSNMVCSSTMVVSLCTNNKCTSPNNQCMVNRASCPPSKLLHGDRPQPLMDKFITTTKIQGKPHGTSQVCFYCMDSLIFLTVVIYFLTVCESFSWYALNALEEGE